MILHSGLNLETTHTKRSRKYTIYKLGNKSSRNERFTLRDGVETSIYDYFDDTYRMKLVHPDLPCVLLTNKTIIPMEVATVSRGQRYIKK